MNAESLTPVTKDHADTYARDGVVHIPGVFDHEWVERLNKATHRAMDGKGFIGRYRYSEDARNYSISWLNRDDMDFYEFETESPAPTVAAKVIGTKELRLYTDTLFIKQGAGGGVTPWHQDAPAWPVKGGMVPSFWVAVTPISGGGSGLHCIAGSHKWDRVFAPKSMVKTLPEGMEWCPDYEKQRDNPDLTFLEFNEIDAGDVLVVHPSTVHFAPENNQDKLRISLSVRYFGDDAVWDPKPYTFPYPRADMTPGTKPGGDLFPLVWSEADSPQSSAAA